MTGQTTQKGQLNFYRQQQKNRFLKQNAGKPITLQSMAEKAQKDEEFKLSAAIGHKVPSGKSEKMGMLCLKLTNDFRRQ